MKKLLPILLLFATLLSCKGNNSDTIAETIVNTPVTVVNISHDSLTEYVELNATATFLQKNYVKANINGYIQSVNIQVGKYVTEGETLFVLKTKEATAIGNAVNKLDPSFKFSGINNIRATGHGFINQLNHQVGDYVQDGEQLAVINDLNSFAFVMDMPYELRQSIVNKKDVIITLPDKTVLTGTISGEMPTVDASAQTQSIIIKVDTKQIIPENLIAKIKIIKDNHVNSVSLPKPAVLSNDIQSEFWVMKLLNDSTAVKVNINKGIESNGQVEILFPAFSDLDKFILTGNFGLADTAKVTITNQE